MAPKDENVLQGKGDRAAAVERLRKRLLEPPKLVAVSDQPPRVDGRFPLDLDSFDLAHRLGPIYDILRHPGTQTPLTIAIYGEWGAGKTSAMRWLESRLQEWNEHEGDAKQGAIRTIPVWFFPWKYQTREDVWRGLVAEVILACLAQAPDQPTAEIEAVKAARFFGGRFRALLAGTKVKTPLLDVDFGKVLSKLDAKAELPVSPAADYLNGFETELFGWLKQFLGPNDRMVVFIDDLDRCTPEVALQVLEALKLYLNIERLVFVVGVDPSVINRLVSQHYDRLGLGKDKSRDYLPKMFQVEATVSPSEIQVVAFLDSVLEANATWLQLPSLARAALRPAFISLARRSPREVKRLVNGALVLGVGIEMSNRVDAADTHPTIQQGVQVELMRRILRDHEREMLLGSTLGEEFFSRWSKAVRASATSAASLDMSVDLVEKVREFHERRRQEATGGSQFPALFDVDLTDVQEPFRKVLELAWFDKLPQILADENLGVLMRIEFSAAAAAAVARRPSDDFAVSDDFAEKIVAEAIAEALGKKCKDVVADDWLQVDNLMLGSKDINDLTPLSRLTNLRQLSLSQIPAQDLSPLAALDNLEWLHMEFMQVKSLQPLGRLPKLTNLNLYHARVADDVHPLSGFDRLFRLSILFGLENLGMYVRLANLRQLDLREERFSNFAALAQLTNLEHLSIMEENKEQRHDLAALWNLKKLRGLRPWFGHDQEQMAEFRRTHPQVVFDSV